MSSEWSTTEHWTIWQFKPGVSWDFILSQMCKPILTLRLPYHQLCNWPIVHLPLTLGGLVADFVKTTLREFYAVIVLTHHCKRTRQERMCWHASSMIWKKRRLSVTRQVAIGKQSLQLTWPCYHRHQQMSLVHDKKASPCQLQCQRNRR